MIHIEIISNGLIADFPIGDKNYYKDFEHLIKCVTEDELERMNEIQKHHVSNGLTYKMEFSIEEITDIPKQ